MFFQVFFANIGATVFIILMIILTIIVTWHIILPKIIDFVQTFIVEPVIEIVNIVIEKIDKVLDDIADIIPSDERLKENITLMGHSDEDHSINVYQYNYIHDAKKKTYVGILAQNLQYTPYQHCLSSDQSGLLRINYKKLGLSFDNKALPYSVEEEQDEEV